MGNVSAFSASVNLPIPAQSLKERRRIESSAVCPWCGSSMYLDRTGERLLCANSITCAGVMMVDQAIPEIGNKLIQKAVA